jgi:hypothetical protein
MKPHDQDNTPNTRRYLAFRQRSGLLQPANGCCMHLTGPRIMRSSGQARVSIHLLQVRTNSMKQLRSEVLCLTIIDSKPRCLFLACGSGWLLRRLGAMLKDWCLSPDLADAGTLPVPGVAVCGVFLAALRSICTAQPRSVAEVNGILRGQIKTPDRGQTTALAPVKLLPGDDVAESLVLVIGVASQLVVQ